MIGTILNVTAILAGGIAGLSTRRPLAGRTQLTLKLLLGVLTVFVGLRMTFTNLGNSLGLIFKQLIVIVLAMILGRLTGRGLRLQKFLNRLGQHAKGRINAASPTNPNRLSEGFITCALLYCAGPISVLGALQDGLGGHWETLAIKAAMDGLATMAFVGTFGWGVILSALPVLAYQGTITLLTARLVTPFLLEHGLMSSVHATGGFLVFSIALIILELKKIELADYLPSLIYAPLLTWLWG